MADDEETETAPKANKLARQSTALSAARNRKSRRDADE